MPPRHKKKRKNQAAAAAAAAAAAKRRDWLVGDLVVAKLRGHRPWPAQIQKPEDYGYEPRPHKIFVTFFGTEETCFCTHNKITPFTSAMRKNMAEQLQKINTNPELERAIKEIFAADDELKVSMKSQNKSDDEISDEEDEQPAEASSKPPRKKAKFSPQEDAIVQDPVVHSAGKESTRTRRAGAAAAAAAAQSAKLEKVTSGGSSVKNMAAHQVQKLPRKVRIKVSSQSSDSANHKSVGEVAVAVTDKASVSSLSQKSEVESPSRSETDAEKKADATSSPSPKSTVAEAECSKNGDVEMEEATGDVAAEVSKKSGERSSAEDEDSIKAAEGDSAKTQVSGDDETMGEPLDVAKEGAVEDREKDCESTAIKMDIDAPSKGVVEAVAVKETEGEGKVEITGSSVDGEQIEKQRSFVAEDEKEQGNGTAEGLHAIGEDRKVAAGMESKEEKCELAAVAKAEDEVCDSIVESEEERNVGDSTAIAIGEETVSESATVATEVNISASTVEATAESKDCKPAIDPIEVKLSDTSVEAREEGKVSSSAAEPVQAGQTWKNRTGDCEEDPAGESMVIIEDVEQSCEKTDSAEKIHIFQEPLASAKEVVKVTTEILEEEVRNSEAPTVAKQEVKDSASLPAEVKQKTPHSEAEDSVPPALVADDVKSCKSPAQVEEGKNCEHLQIAKDRLKDSAADAEQEENSCENAAPVKDAVQEDDMNCERAVKVSEVEKDSHSLPSVDTVMEDNEGESTPQLKQEGHDREGMLADKAVEKEIETTATASSVVVATEGALEKDEEQEGNKEVVKKDEEQEGKKEEAVKKDEEHERKKEEAVKKDEEQEGKKEEALKKDEEQEGKKEEALKKDEEQEGKKEEALKKDEEPEGKKEEALKKDEEQEGRKEEALKKDEEQEGKKDGGKVDMAMDADCNVVPAEKEEKLPDSVEEDGVKSKLAAAAATVHEQIGKDETASAMPAVD